MFYVHFVTSRNFLCVSISHSVSLKILFLVFFGGMNIIAFVQANSPQKSSEETRKENIKLSHKPLQPIEKPKTLVKGKIGIADYF